MGAFETVFVAQLAQCQELFLSKLLTTNCRLAGAKNFLPVDRQGQLSEICLSCASERRAHSSPELQREQQYADFETGQWQLPINHRVEDGLDTDARLADANTALSEENVGFKMLQRMGWKGKGLGRAEQGAKIY